MLRDYLAPEHLELSAAHTGEDGLRMFAEQDVDLLILDIMLPGISGLDVLRDVRKTSDTPVVMLTARGDDVDRIIGLEFGADDYLAKPFNPRELSARIKAILRRAQPATRRSETLTVGGIRLDTLSRRVLIGDEALRLTGTEFEILRCLLDAPGEVVSKDQLSEHALGRKLMPYDRSIDTHISNLRGKLVRAGADEGAISNQRGVGYVLLPGKLKNA